MRYNQGTVLSDFVPYRLKDLRHLAIPNRLSNPLANIAGSNTKQTISLGLLRYFGLYCLSWICSMAASLPRTLIIIVGGNLFALFFGVDVGWWVYGRSGSLRE